jgi:hypothetical protein
MRQVLLVAGALVIGGCAGGPAIPPQVMVGPHGGTAYRLPGDRGFVELVNEPAVDTPRPGAKTALVVYFLQDDAKSPVTSAPTDVRADVMVERRAVKLVLKPEPKADDPAGSARFATALGPYHLADVRGNLTASAGGESATIAFASGR